MRRLPTSPKTVGDSFQDIKDILDFLNGMHFGVGQACLFPAGFSNPNYMLADGTAIPENAVDARAVWGDYSPDLTGEAPSGTQYFIKLW